MSLRSSRPLASTARAWQHLGVALWDVAALGYVDVGCAAGANEGFRGWASLRPLVAKSPAGIEQVAARDELEVEVASGAYGLAGDEAATGGEHADGSGKRFAVLTRRGSGSSCQPDRPRQPACGCARADDDAPAIVDGGTEQRLPARHRVHAGSAEVEGGPSGRAAGRIVRGERDVAAGGHAQFP
jgi:hypothetical protein